MHALEGDSERRTLGRDASARFAVDTAATVTCRKVILREYTVCHVLWLLSLLFFSSRLCRIDHASSPSSHRVIGDPKRVFTFHARRRQIRDSIVTASRQYPCHCASGFERAAFWLVTPPPLLNGGSCPERRETSSGASAGLEGTRMLAKGPINFGLMTSERHLI